MNRVKRAMTMLSMTATVIVALLVMTIPASAQYGGVSGLFVTTSPDRPGVADFSGLGCGGGSEVVLYFPGLQPRSSDPVASQSVPGRILAVTTAVTSPDALINGTFSFPNVEIPTDLEPGVYEVHARCGPLDLRVLIQVNGNGLITIDPDPNAPINNETSNGSNGIPGQLPFTGRDPSRTLSMGAGVIAAGIAVVAFSRRPQRTR